MFAILLLDIIGLSARYSKTSLIYEGVSPSAGTAGYCFSPTPGMPGAMIFGVPSAADKPIEDKMQSIGAMNIIVVPREKSKRSISIAAAMALPCWCQVRMNPPAANARLTQTLSCTFS
ncbi:MAG TPA: hypothetical protein HPQ03_00130 [Deltaproteobacteria bacterium]|nr:hypothetical protein [Deltaproteobacteria bacterium]